MRIDEILLLKEKNTVDIEFPDTVPRKTTIKLCWYAKFRCGEMSTEDGERIERPKEVVTDKNIIKSTKN